MAFPDEVIGGGNINVYVAPLATAFPLMGVTVPAPWVLMGVGGNLNITEEGVQITSSVETSEFTPLGDILPVKSWLTSQDLRVRFQVADLSLETLSHAMGGPATAAGNVTTTAAGSGTVGYKSLTLNRSGIPSQVAMLIRLEQSPYGVAFTPAPRLQYELFRVSQVAEVPLVHVKDQPVMTQFEYRIFRDALGVGNIRAVNASAL